ncbi:HalOD1 output domain-containing protein [Halomicroarcula sp. GCM10025709]|uniref:HalOD1 output domain-containing protein n=1 Tax=Haloarcula TaxID=2237 RepID=UPI0024C44764|nr:HalOD1 output domain-containing protein [Halomicroarcula sp. YJ-61-S]
MSSEQPNPFDEHAEHVSYATHDWSDEWPISGTVVDAIAHHCGTDPIDLAPLYRHVDVDALDQLVTSSADSSRPEGHCRITFDYDGDEVTVTHDGEVTVRTGGVAPDQDGIDEATFERELARLVRAAAANGVDVSGAWPVRDETPSQNWRIEIIAGR